MKKILLIASTLILVFSMLAIGVNAQAENKLTTTWQQGLIKAGTVENKTDTDGTAYVSATGIDNPWVSPTIDVLEAVKSALGTEE